MPEAGSLEGPTQRHRMTVAFLPKSPGRRAARRMRGIEAEERNSGKWELCGDGVRSH